MNKYKDAYEMKWGINESPHGLINILRGCNCKCQTCYNNSDIKTRNFEDIKKDIDEMLLQRKVSTIGLIGGEPLLHKDILKIAEYIKSKNISVEIISNGILTDEKTVKELYKNGVKLVFLHIDYNQIRPDIKENNMEKADKLRSEKSELLCKNGITAGMSITIDTIGFEKDFTHYLNYFKTSKYIDVFLLTLYKNVNSYGEIIGDINTGLQGKPNNRDKSKEIHINDVSEYLEKNEKINPYWYITGHIDKENPRWITYIYAVGFDRKGNSSEILNMKYSKFEKMYLEYYKKKYKKYPMYKKQKTGINRVHILLNGIMGGNLIKNLLFIIKTIKSEVMIKRIIVQDLAEIQEDGRVEYCENCPDATIKNGKLIPNCISDYVENH